MASDYGVMAHSKRIIGWFVGLTALTLLAVILTTRTVMLSGVTDDANHDVVQETEEFHTFAEQGVDPETSQPFGSAERLLAVYLSRQIPGEDEALVGVLEEPRRAEGYRLVQMENSPRMLKADNPNLQAILKGEQHSGIAHSDSGDPVHWGRVDVPGGHLVVARFTDTARAGVAGDLRAITTISVVALALSTLLAWFLVRRILPQVGRRSAQLPVVGADVVLGGVVKQCEELGLPVEAVAAEPVLVRADVPELARALGAAAEFCAELSAPVQVGAQARGAGVALWVKELAVGAEPKAVDAVVEDLRPVADAHGGTAWAESTPGAGTTVGIDLPGVEVVGDQQ